MTTFKMDETNLQVLIATADLGAMAFAYGDHCFPDKCGSGAKFADTVNRVTGEIMDSFEENNCKVTLNDDEYVVMLIAVRGAFEAFMSLSEGGLKRMLNMFTDKLQGCEKSDRKKMAHTAHVVLDFLECHATPKVMSEWIKERRDSARTMLENVTDAYGEAKEE
tara:strand:- start:51 stop:542 length:492 start_codon:yes stop_codon:yes gene_type:complete